MKATLNRQKSDSTGWTVIDLSDHMHTLITTTDYKDLVPGTPYIPNMVTISDWSVNPQRVINKMLIGFTGYIDESTYEVWDSMYPDASPYKGYYGKTLQPLTQSPFWLQQLVRKYR